MPRPPQLTLLLGHSCSASSRRVAAQLPGSAAATARSGGASCGPCRAAAGLHSSVEAAATNSTSGRPKSANNRSDRGRQARCDGMSPRDLSIASEPPSRRRRNRSRRQRSQRASPPVASWPPQHACCPTPAQLHASQIRQLWYTLKARRISKEAAAARAGCVTTPASTRAARACCRRSPATTGRHLSSR